MGVPLMVRNRQYRSIGYLNVVAGTVMVLSGFINHVFLFAASFVAAAVWFISSAMALRAEAGPAFFGRPARVRKARVNARVRQEL